MSCDSADEDYIDMEVSSFYSFCNSLSSSPNPREFEFQMSGSSVEKDSTTSPADELFYKGNLLPLHLPPRLQMVEKLLQKSNSIYEYYSTPAFTTPTNTSTPFESCAVSPSESCHVSKELNPEEYFLEMSELKGSKKSWTKKLKLVKQSTLKASKACLRSLFGGSGGSDKSLSSSAAKVADVGSVLKAKQATNKYINMAKKKIPFGQIQKERYLSSASVDRCLDKEAINDYSSGSHRRSFLVSVKRQITNKPSSTSNNSHFRPLQFLKRSNSVNSDIENPIQGAIAHCKESQQVMRSRKTLSEVGFYSISASKLAVYDDQEMAQVCRD